ncbi:MAG: dihydrodipicolinate reductase [Pseudomonadota bacterium]
MSKTYRVIQWATGSVGKESLRAILVHPQLELAGVFVYSPDKSGIDAGELCGMAATGVVATNDRQAILDCDADCVMYAPRHADVDEVCALLRSGKNVAATPFMFHRKSSYNDDQEKVEAACREGGVSIHGTGIHPGFLGMVLPVALSGMSRTIEHVRLEERADWSFYDSPRITFDNMRFGHPPDEASMDANPFARFTADIFGQQVWMLSEALGADIDEVQTEHELTTAPEAKDIRAGRLEVGTVAGQRFCWSGVCAGKTWIEIEVLWTVGGFYPDHWPRPKDGWTISIEGDPSFRTHFLTAASLGKRQVSIDDHVQAAGSTTTAMQPVNSIPAICEAAPGWRTSVELGLIGAGIGFRHPSVWQPVD